MKYTCFELLIKIQNHTDKYRISRMHGIHYTLMYSVKGSRIKRSEGKKKKRSEDVFKMLYGLFYLHSLVSTRVQPMKEPLRLLSMSLLLGCSVAIRVIFLDSSLSSSLSASHFICSSACFHLLHTHMRQIFHMYICRTIYKNLNPHWRGIDEPLCFWILEQRSSLHFGNRCVIGGWRETPFVSSCHSASALLCCCRAAAAAAGHFAFISLAAVRSNKEKKKKLLHRRWCSS